MTEIVICSVSVLPRNRITVKINDSSFCWGHPGTLSRTPGGLWLRATGLNRDLPQIMLMCQSEICLVRWTWAGDLALSESAYAVWLIPDLTFFWAFFPLSSVPHAPFHPFLLILGAGRRPCQPQACPSCTDPDWGADNWAAVIPWRTLAWRKVRCTGAALENCQSSGPWQTAQVVYPRKHNECHVNEVVWMRKMEFTVLWWNLDFDTVSAMYWIESWFYNIM